MKEEGGVTVAQMRKVVNFLKPHGNVASREEKTHDGFPLLSRLVESGRRLYVQAVVGIGKGHDQKIDLSDSSFFEVLSKQECCFCTYIHLGIKSYTNTDGLG